MFFTGHTKGEKDPYQEKWPNVSAALSKQAKKACSIEGLHKRLPITEWLPKYRKSYIVEDIVAGLTVGLSKFVYGK